MAAIVDERAPGVSAALRRRIAAALDSGERPTLQRNNLRLGSIFLQRADGRDRPALRSRTSDGPPQPEHIRRV